MKPFWVTFYSYKGGVGRTLAMVNAAAILVKSGRNVLLVDFDLEAPGLDSFVELGVPSGRKGVVEYFSDFARCVKAPRLADYVLQQAVLSPKHGCMWIMTSGTKNRQYNELRDSLNWTRLYDSGLGPLMIEEWKATIGSEYSPDYVFVDSRTGLTEIGGVCTLHLPDLVVVLFALNKQNIDGAASVINAIEEAEGERKPQIITVATPVPESSVTLVEEAIASASSAMGQKPDVRIGYSPAAALSERIFALENAESPRQLISEYEELVVDIKRANVSGLDGLLMRGERTREIDDERDGLAICMTLQEQHGDRLDAIVEIAELTRQFKGRQHAVTYWRKAFDIDPTLVNAFNTLVNHYKSARNHVEIVKLADKFLENLHTPPTEDDRDALFEKGEALMALERYTSAIDCYEPLYSMEPDEVAYLFNYAEAVRRGTMELSELIWKRVVEVFGKGGPSTDPNKLQAMHIAHACVGETKRAMELLKQARIRALSQDTLGDIFSVKTFQYVDKKQFLVENAEFLRALEKGKLWDGMPVPAENSPANGTKH